MAYQFILELPEGLEKFYRSGEIVVNSGVARFVGNQSIAAHLEMIGPTTQFVAGTNPCLGMARVALEAVKVGKGMVIDTAKLNQIIGLTEQIKTLSAVNLAVSSVTLGVVAAGFAAVMYKLDEIDKKLDEISAQIQALDEKVSQLVKNESAKLIEKVRRHIKHCITFINQLEDLGWSPHLDSDILKLFDSIEALLELLIGKYLGRDFINVSLELTQCLYNSYANLLKVYLTHRYKQQKSLNYSGYRLESLDNFAGKLSSSDIVDELYEQFLLNQEKRFTEGELDVILALYCYGCQSTHQNVSDHYEILNVTPMQTYKRWQQLIEQKPSLLHLA
jgi:hypothetical protein